MIIDVLNVSIADDSTETDMRLSKSEYATNESDEKKKFDKSEKRLCKMTDDA